MNPPDDTRAHLDALYEELEALKIRIAFAEMDWAQESQPIAADDAAFSDVGFQKALSTIKTQADQVSQRKSLHKMLLRVSHIAAALLLISNIGFATAITTVPSFRIQVVEFIMNSGEKYTTLRLQPVEGSQVVIPVGWQGLYFPSYIPEGYELAFIDEYPYCDIVYQNQEAHKLYFSECDDSVSANVDTENAINYYTTVQNQSALVSIKNGYTMIVWSTENQYFILRIQENEETALRIANSVKLIK